MIDPKPHLKDLYRLKLGDMTRRDNLRLDMNESISGLPSKFVEGIISEINSNFLSAYPEYDIFLKKLAKYNHLQPENICLSNGSDAAIKHIFDAYVSPKDKVLLTDPSFAMYPVYCSMFDSDPVIVEYNPDLSFPKEEFKKKISGEIRLAVIVSPNNPTGSVLSNNDLIEIIEEARLNNVLIIIDEAYFYFYPETVIEEVKRFDNLIVLRTFSKLCGIAAARLGYAAACPEVIENLTKVRPTFDVNGISILFAERLIDNPDVIEELIKETNDSKKYLTENLSEQGIEHITGNANFVLIKCDDKVEEIIGKLAENKILINGGFKQSFLKDYIRVSVGDIPSMKKFWEAFMLLKKNGN